MSLKGPELLRGLSLRQADTRQFWLFSASLVFLLLFLASFAQDLLHTSYLSHRPKVPYDFPT